MMATEEEPNVGAEAQKDVTKEEATTSEQQSQESTVTQPEQADDGSGGKETGETDNEPKRDTGEMEEVIDEDLKNDELSEPEDGKDKLSEVTELEKEDEVKLTSFTDTGFLGVDALTEDQPTRMAALASDPSRIQGGEQVINEISGLIVEKMHGSFMNQLNKFLNYFGLEIKNDLIKNVTPYLILLLFITFIYLLINQVNKMYPGDELKDEPLFSLSGK